MKTISKRWIKNAVAIVVMLALCGSMFFTMSYAKSHAQASDMPQMAEGHHRINPDPAIPTAKAAISRIRRAAATSRIHRAAATSRVGRTAAVSRVGRAAATSRVDSLQLSRRILEIADSPETVNSPEIADSPETAPTCRRVHQIRAKTFPLSTTSSLGQKVSCWHWH